MMIGGYSLLNYLLVALTVLSVSLAVYSILLEPNCWWVNAIFSVLMLVATVIIFRYAAKKENKKIAWYNWMLSTIAFFFMLALTVGICFRLLNEKYPSFD